MSTGDYLSISNGCCDLFGSRLMLQGNSHKVIEVLGTSRFGLSESVFVPLVHSMKLLEKDIKGRDVLEGNVSIGTDSVNEDSLEQLWKLLESKVRGLELKGGINSHDLLYVVIKEKGLVGMTEGL